MAPEEENVLRVYIDGARVLDPAGAGITFTSTDNTIATVSAAGVIHAVSVGNATITATLGDSSATVSVVVGG